MSAERGGVGGHTCPVRGDGPCVNGVRIDPVGPDEFLGRVSSFVECGRPHVMHFCAAHPTVEARHDPAYRGLLNRGDLNLADGMPVAWACRLMGSRAERLAGTEGMNLTCAWGVDRGLRHFLYGASLETLDLLRTQLEMRHPGIKIVGAESPPFRPIPDEELDETLARIREAGAEAIWVGLGTPKQDLMAARLRERDAAPLIFCVGAAFDFVAGVKKRAPTWMRRWGLEWAYRLLSEPGRLWKRYLVGNTRFVAGVVTDRVRGVGVHPR